MDRETRELAFQLAFGFCMCSKGCVETATEIHHKLPNTKINKKRFPLFIDSIFNFCPISNDCHMTKPLPKIREHEAEIYETWLRKSHDK